MKNKRAMIQEILMITLATIITAAGVFFFLMPSNLAVGSVSGLSIIVANFIPLPISTITMIFNVGLAMLFNRNASSGGLDIVAKLLNKFLHMDLGTAMALPGMVVALSAAFVYDAKIVFLSVLGTYLHGIIIDHFIFGFDMKKRVCIVSEKEEEIRQFILNELHSGATIYEAIGAYNFKKRTEIITIVDKNEYAKVMTFIEKIDSEAFVTIYTVHRVLYRPKV